MGDGRYADCYVQYDARLGLQALDAALEDHTATGFHTQEVKDRLAVAWEDPRRYEIPEGTIDPRQAVRALDEALPSDIGMILGGGQQNHFGIMLANNPREWLLPNLHFASIGQGLTTAMGAVIAMGRAPAFLMEGDGGFMMHLAEFETAVRYRLPLLVCVFNDEGYGAEYHHHVGNEGVNIDIVTISSPDLGAVGAALGGRGALVRSTDELRRVAAEFAADPRPTLVDVRIARTVTSIPNRRRYRGEADQ
jgi:thiamine pyrophosphate-dependent acetolactate synthase large subunit-like protein